MKSYIIEKEWISNSLKCIVVFQKGGYRCGYVEVPQTHPLFGKHYNNYINDSINVEIKDFFNVHGGITFSGEFSDSTHNDWCFGFDCAHWDDKIDFDLAEKYFPEEKTLYSILKNTSIKFNEEESIKTLDYVVEQCENLAKQLVDYTKNFVKINTKKNKIYINIKKRKESKNMNFTKSLNSKNISVSTEEVIQYIITKNYTIALSILLL